MSEQQLRADLFELGQLSRAVGLDPVQVGAHVAAIRRDAAALVADPEFGALAAEVVAACDGLELQEAPPPPALPTRPPPPPEPEPEPEPEVEVLRIGLTCGSQRWVWVFPEDEARLRREWADGYVPAHLTPDRPAYRGILGEITAVDALPDVDLTATLTSDACTLHLPDGDVVWALHIDVAVELDGVHVGTWAFPQAEDRLLEEWRAGRAPLQQMPRPRAYDRGFLGELGAATGRESARLLLAPGHETCLQVRGVSHRLEAPLDMAGHWHFEALGEALHADTTVRHFGRDDQFPRANAVGVEGEHLVRLAVYDLPADALRGARLSKVRDLIVSSADPEVLSVLIAGTSARSLRTLVLRVDAPALVAHASKALSIELHGVPVPRLPSTLRQLHVSGPVDVDVLEERLRGCSELRMLVLRGHALDEASLARLSGPWVLDSGTSSVVEGWEATGLDDELAGLQVPWDVLDPILERWVVKLLADVATIFEREGAPLRMPQHKDARAAAVAGAAALTRAAPTNAALAWLVSEVTPALERVREGLDGDFGNDFGVWMRPLSSVVVRTSALAALWRAGQSPPTSVGDPRERARQVEEITAAAAP